VGNVAEKMTFGEMVMPLSPPGDGQFHDLYFVFKNDNAPANPVTIVDWIRFDPVSQIR